MKQDAVGTKPLIRPLDAEERALAVDWAAAEGWNPGLADAAAFGAADPDGFLGLFDRTDLVSAVSAIRYGATFGFIGFYICRPERRGEGLGKAVWDAGTARLAGRTIGLDGVVAQQSSYQREGFVLAHRNIRYAGTARPPAAQRLPLVEIGADASEDAIWALIGYDAAFFPDDRQAFLRAWMQAPGHRTLAAFVGGSVLGYGTIRPCRQGCKIGPLFADDLGIAAALFAGLAEGAPGGTVILDVPEPNDAARRLAEEAGLAPIFETARMYRGASPDLPLGRTYGITSFELG